MAFSFFTRRRRARLLASAFDPALRAWMVSGFAAQRGLDAGETEKLVGLARILVGEKHWEGCGGLVLTDEIKHVIAAQAALLILGVDGEPALAPVFPNVRTILVYPSAYTVPGTRPHESAHLPGVRAGEAHANGPIILSWDDAKRGCYDPRDGKNVVFHEFAHALDMLNGFVDGTPPLPGNTAAATWREVMTAEYGRLIADEAYGTPTVLDTYGATNPAEFFAVSTENFFERPGLLRERHQDLYAILRMYYRQDPGARLGARLGVRPGVRLPFAG